MKLFEIAQIMTVDSAMDSVERYVRHYERDRKFDRSVEYLMHNPKFVYTGSMVRALNVPAPQLVKTSDVRLLLSRLHSYEMRRRQKYFSWSKTIPSMLRAIENNVEGMVTTGWTTFVVLAQDGRGLDIGKLPLSVDRETMTLFRQEKEVLSQIDNSVHLGGFLLGGDFYRANEYRRFINDVRESWLHQSV